jgi:AcrR family transcriptional regulator
VLTQARHAFAERGFEGTTLADIGARLGVSPAALLRHARSKQELFSLALESEPETEPLPSDFLVTIPPSQDPLRVLRRLALGLVPFIERKMGENIARFLRARSEEEARTIRLPFDPRRKSSPPARVVAALEGYLRRARAARRLSVRDPRAAALAFVGSLQAYVFFHRVLRLDPPIPFDGYLDTVLDIWKRGALRDADR